MLRIVPAVHRREFVALLAAGTAAVLVVPAKGASTQYFPSTEPVAVLSPQFDRYLAAMAEQPLPDLADVDYVLRVTVLMEQREVITLRVARGSNGVVRSTFKKHAFLSSGDLSRVPSRTETERISSADFSRVVEEIQRQSFFAIGPPDVWTTGGSLWLLEVLDGKRYHAAFIFGRPRNTPFGAVVAAAARIARVAELVP
jgi:hypothetical protein